jgi:hypothetical protein
MAEMVLLDQEHEKKLGTSYIPSVKHFLIRFDFSRLQMLRFLGNTSPVVFLLPSSADSLA